MFKVGKRQSIGITIAVAILLAVGLFIWAFSRPSGQKETDNNQPAPIEDVEVAEEENTSEPAADEAATPTIDPETVSTVAIDSLALSVPYIKGIPGFSYSISRTGSGTQYVDFVSDQLKGTKCTDDEGVFATIIQSPNADEDQTTLTLTKEVNGSTYGLSLPSDTCTADAALFAQYQQSFKDAFGLLKAL